MYNVSPLQLVGLIVALNLTIWGLVLTILKYAARRYGDRPAELSGSETPETALEKVPNSYYLETDFPNRRRFLGWGFMVRGNGVFYMGASGLYFLRYATTDPLYIPYRYITGIDVGPSGRAKTGRLPMLHINWQYRDMILTSFIAVSRSEENTRNWAAKIREHLKK